MSQVIDYSGDEEFLYRGSKYANRKGSGIPFMSLDHQVDVFSPCKRARISAPVVSTSVPSAAQHNNQALIDVLPNECLFEILRRLPGGEERSSCACVSKRWLGLVSTIQSEELCGKATSNVQEDMDISDGFLTRCVEGKKATDIKLAAIAVGVSSRGGLGKLIIRGSNSTLGVTNLGLKAIAACCPSLKVLSLCNVPSIGDEGLVQIAKACRNLEKLDLSRCPLITDKALVEVAKGCPRLKSLSIESCPHIQNEGLQAVGQFCSSLKSISIKDCHLVGDQGIGSLLSSAGNTLTKVKLEGLHISDISLAVLGHYCHVVTELALVGLQNINEKGFWCMGRGHSLQKLKFLTISSCRGVTDTGLESLGNGCPNMKSFSLSKSAFVSDNGLVSFVKAAISLENLQLEECHRITQVGFFSLILLSCGGSKLKSLSFTSCFGIKDMPLGVTLPRSSRSSIQTLAIRNCPLFGNVNLTLLADLCSAVSRLNLSKLHGVSDDGLVTLIDNLDAGLVEVKLADCVNLTNKSVLALTRIHGGTLVSLSLEGCGKVTDASLVGIANDCLQLHDLDVSRCAITDLGLAALARAKQMVSSLGVLSLSGCSMLSDKCLLSLVKLGQSLKGLNLYQCNGISSSVVGMVEERLWRCDVLC